MKTTKKLGRVLSVVLVAAALSACTATGGQKQTGGTLLGAGLGALAGSQIGSGRGKLAAVARSDARSGGDEEVVVRGAGGGELREASSLPHVEAAAACI